MGASPPGPGASKSPQAQNSGSRMALASGGLAPFHKGIQALLSVSGPY